MPFGTAQISNQLGMYFSFMTTCEHCASFLVVVRFVSDHGKTNNLSQFSFVAWSLWDRRNLQLHEDKITSPIEAVERAFSVWHSHSQSLPSPDPITWEAPPIEYLKLNVDRAMFVESQKASVGAIVQDHARKVILVSSFPKENVADAKSIEAIAIIRGLQICMHQCISKLIIESDCLGVVEEISDRNECYSDLGNVYLDVKDLMSRFVFSKLQYGNRLGNFAAHYFARNVWHSSNISLWHGVLSDFLTS